MQVIKILIAMSIINAVVMIGVVTYGTPMAPTLAVATPIQVEISPSPIASLAPTALPKAVKSTPLPSLLSIARPTSTPARTSTPAPKVTPPPTTPAPTPDSRCLIQIDGVKYNVTQFRNLHSGGNVFSCGTDMSQIFWSRHNQAILNMMQQYRI